MVEGAGARSISGFTAPRVTRRTTTLFLSLGPVLIGRALRLATVRRDTIRAAAPSIALTITAITLLFLVRLNVDQAWVGFRAGQWSWSPFRL